MNTVVGDHLQDGGGDLLTQQQLAVQIAAFGIPDELPDLFNAGRTFDDPIDAVQQVDLVEINQIQMKIQLFHRGLAGVTEGIAGRDQIAFSRLQRLDVTVGNDVGIAVCDVVEP